jgi:hypothetical protein
VADIEEADRESRTPIAILDVAPTETNQPPPFAEMEMTHDYQQKLRETTRQTGQSDTRRRDV